MSFEVFRISKRYVALLTPMFPSIFVFGIVYDNVLTILEGDKH